MTIQRNESEVAMGHASKFIQLISIAIHADLEFTNRLLKAMGLSLKDFTHEDKVLGDNKSKADASELAKDSDPESDVLKKVFTSTEVDVLLDEIRQSKARRMGAGQARANRGDTGAQIFGPDGLKNVVAPELVSELLDDGFALIEVQRERKPRRYTQGDVKKAQAWRRDEKKLPAECSVKPVPTGENGKVTEEDLKRAKEAQVAYFDSIEEGLLKKTHPTVAKPAGTTQVWKYVVRAMFLRSDENGGAMKIARTFEDKVLKTSIWENGHLWENPDGSVTVNFTPLPQGQPKFLTRIDYDAEGEDFLTKVGINKDHRDYEPPPPGFEKVDLKTINQELRKAANKERARIAYERREADGYREWRREHKELRDATRALGRDLQAKLEGKANGDNTPLPPAS